MSKKPENDLPRNEPAATGPAGAPTSPETASLMQVREILTGPLASDFRQRIDDFDRRFAASLEEFREANGKRLDAFETACNERIGRLEEELRSQRGQQQERLEKLERELSVGLEQMRGRLDEAKRMLRTELVDRDSLSAALSEVAIRLAVPTDPGHPVDPDQSDLEIDKILDGATSG